MSEKTIYVDVEFSSVFDFLLYMIEQLEAAKRPQKKRQVAIVYKYQQSVVFWADKEIAMKFTEFGKLTELTNNTHWNLLYNPCYDKEDVLKYMESFNE